MIRLALIVFFVCTTACADETDYPEPDEKLTERVQRIVAVNQRRLYGRKNLIRLAKLTSALDLTDDQLLLLGELPEFSPGGVSARLQRDFGTPLERMSKRAFRSYLGRLQRACTSELAAHNQAVDSILTTPQRSMVSAAGMLFYLTNLADVESAFGFAGHELRGAEIAGLAKQVSELNTLYHRAGERALRVARRRVMVAQIGAKRVDKMLGPEVLFSGPFDAFDPHLVERLDSPADLSLVGLPATVFRVPWANPLRRQKSLVGIATSTLGRALFEIGGRLGENGVKLSKSDVEGIQTLNDASYSRIADTLRAKEWRSMSPDEMREQFPSVATELADIRREHASALAARLGEKRCDRARQLRAQFYAVEQGFVVYLLESEGVVQSEDRIADLTTAIAVAEDAVTVRYFLACHTEYIRIFREYDAAHPGSRLESVYRQITKPYVKRGSPESNRRNPRRRN